MRKLAPLLVLILCCGLPACRSGNAPIPEEDREPERDYRSINKTSVAFIKDSVRSARRDRKGYWSELKDSRSYRRARNKRIRKESRSFAGKSFTAGTRQGTRQMWKSLKEELKWPDDMGDRARFGFLDSGE